MLLLLFSGYFNRKWCIILDPKKYNFVDILWIPSQSRPLPLRIHSHTCWWGWFRGWSWRRKSELIAPGGSSEHSDICEGSQATSYPRNKPLRKHNRFGHPQSPYQSWSPIFGGCRFVLLFIFNAVREKRILSFTKVIKVIKNIIKIQVFRPA